MCGATSVMCKNILHSVQTNSSLIADTTYRLSKINGQVYQMKPNNNFQK